MKINSFHEKNKKKKFIIIFSVVCMMLVVGVFLYTSYAWFESEKVFNSFSGNVGNVGDIYFSIYVDGVASNFVPSSYDRINFDHAECTNGATVTWDNDSWAPIVNNLTISRTKCTLFFVDNSASTVITKLVGDADPSSTAVIDNGTDESGCTNTLAYDDFGNLRYVGSNPCNYVTFNGEEAGWRIIGVFDNQIKLIRNESIGKYVWDTSASSVNNGWGINQWGESGTYTGADLMKLLNPGYDTNLAENSSGTTISGTYVNNSLYWNKGTGNCYNNEKNAYTTCDFSTTGLTEAAKGMIDKHTWNLGSQGNNDVWTNGLGSISEFYEYERSNNNGKTCSSDRYCNDTVNRTTIWEGYVGLMYLSDYGYAVGGEARTNCLDNTAFYNYNTNSCKSNDWLYKTSIYQLILSPNAYPSNASNVFRVDSYGYVATAVASDDSVVRPALFLESQVKITGGNGSQTNPYILSLE